MENHEDHHYDHHGRRMSAEEIARPKITPENSEPTVEDVYAHIDQQVHSHHHAAQDYHQESGE